MAMSPWHRQHSLQPPGRRQEASSRGGDTNLSRIVPRIRHHRAEPPVQRGASLPNVEEVGGSRRRRTPRWRSTEDRRSASCLHRGKGAFAHQYATVSRQVRSPKLDRAERKRLNQLDRHTCTECRNGRTECCSDFTEEELPQAIQKTQLRKSIGPDEITPEMP